MLKDLLKQRDFMAKIDLKDTYFAVPISEPDKNYLRFRCKYQMYQFNSLPFGLSCAPWVFTKIKGSSSSLEGDGHKNYNLHRQHVDHGRIGDFAEISC